MRCSLRPTLAGMLAVMVLGVAPVLGQLQKPPTSMPSDRKARLAARADSKLESDAAEIFRTAETTYLVGDTERAAELYKKLITLAPNSSLDVRAHARLGDCAYEENRFLDAAGAYRKAANLAEDAIDADEQAAGLRADFMVGYSYVGAHEYTQAFGQLRRFIDRHPGHPLVNLAYQAIGDAHLALEQYQQALDAYRMVGTVLGDNKAANHRIAPGERLYLRVVDADVNIGDTPRTVNVTVKTTHGDVETVELQPLGLHSAVFIGSLPTVLGEPRHSDDLYAIFSQEMENAVRDQIARAQTLADQGDQKAAEAKELENSANGSGDPAGVEKSRAAAQSQADALHKQADAINGDAFKKVDAAFAGLEKIVADWSPEQSLAHLRQRQAATAPSTAPAGGVNGELNIAGLLDASEMPTTQAVNIADQDATAAAASIDPDQVQRGMDHRQVDEIRLDAATAPTSAANADRRLSALTVWVSSLHHQFQAVELVGSDTITLEYFDEIGPAGPNDPVKGIRRDTLTVASDARLSLLTPDGKQALQSIILGSDVLLRVEDPDCDLTAQADTVHLTLAALPPAAQAGPDLNPATEPTTQLATPGEIEAASTQPAPVLPLVPDGASAITVTLSETGPHTGIFERKVHIDDKSVSADGQTLALVDGGRLRVAYRDDRCIRHPDGWVLAQEATLAASRGGSLAAVRYQNTRLDLDAQLRRAIAAGEIGKVYLDLGLVQRGRDYLASAENDCMAVANAAANTPLGEEAFYHSWRIYFYAGMLDDAAHAAQTLMARYPNSEFVPPAMLQLGQVSLERGEQAADQDRADGKEPGLNRDLQRAISDLDDLVAKYPRSDQAPEALFLIGQAQITAGKSGIDSFERLAKTYPDSGFAPRGLTRAADYYIGVGDYRRAQEYLSRILIDYPDSPDLGQVLLNRGVCQFKLGQSTEALLTLYRVMEDHAGTEMAHTAQQYIDMINKKRGQ